eukprot:scaffold182291_cov23-Cyclotella_meneghiniana.AAC.1
MRGRRGGGGGSLMIGGVAIAAVGRRFTSGSTGGQGFSAGCASFHRSWCVNGERRTASSPLVMYHTSASHTPNTTPGNTPPSDRLDHPHKDHTTPIRQGAY